MANAPTGTSSSKQMHSFDVFDTVLTRVVSPPTAAFKLVEERVRDVLPRGNCPSTFAKARRSAQQRAQRWHGPRTTLAHIYQELSYVNQSTDWKRVKEIELEVESDLLVPVPQGEALLKSSRAEGHPVVFISDMYLPAAFIRTQLEIHNLWMPGDRLFVSCEHGSKKGHGLFDVVCEDIGISPGQLTHYGNCEYADVQGARSNGSRGVHVAAANANRYESAFERWSDQTSGLSALMAGAARLARLREPADQTPHEHALYSTAAGVLAPVCTAFAMWLLQQARSNRLKRLYLTSRDGHVLIPILRQLAPAVGVECEFRYLYASRAALAAAHRDPSVWDRSFEFETANVGALARHENSVSDRAVRRSVRGSSGEKGETEPGSELEGRRRLLCEYLRQEGLDGPPRSGFVDVGWKGTVHSLLNDVLTDEGMINGPLPGFFFGLSAKQQPYKAHRTAYFFDAHAQTGHRDTLNGSSIYTLLEMFCTADHGSVIGYERQGSSVRPVLESTWKLRMQEWRLPVVRHAVDSFVSVMTQHPTLLNTTADVRPALEEVIRLFWNAPTAAEADAWGRFPREQGGTHEKAPEPLAPPYTWAAPLAFARHGPSAHEKLTHRFSWPAASLLRSAPAVRFGIRQALSLRRKVKHAYKALRRRMATSNP